MTVENKRVVGIDFLRILSMYLAVVLHVQGQGGLVDRTQMFSLQYGVVWFLHIAAYCAVNCFGMISGYVMAESGFKVRNLIALWMQVIFYSMGITVLAAVLGWMDPNRAFWLKSMFPVYGEQYWYFTAYFGMAILSPVLIYAVRHMPQKLLRTTLLGAVVFLATVSVFSGRDPFLYDQGYTSAWLMVLFLVGGYIRRYGLLRSRSKKWLLGAYVAFVLAAWFLHGVTDALKMQGIVSKTFGKLFITYLSPLVLGSAVMLFLIFERMPFAPRASKVIGTLSPLAFGVYLAHTHPVVWNWLGSRFVFLLQQPVFVTIAGVLVIAAGIYALASVVDACRMLLFKAVGVRRFAAFLENMLHKTAEWLCSRFA